MQKPKMRYHGYYPYFSYLASMVVARDFWKSYICFLLKFTMSPGVIVVIMMFFFLVNVASITVSMKDRLSKEVFISRHFEI